MESTDSTIGAAADRVQGLQISDENHLPAKAESVATKDLNLTTTQAHVIDTYRNPSADPGANSAIIPATNGSDAMTAGNSIMEPTTNDYLVPGSIDNKAQQANPQNLVHGEAKTNDIPDIQINGEPEAEHVNTEIMGPEDEEDGETPVLQNSGNTNVGQKRKTKKKSKSKRGLVTAPRCWYGMITLTVEPRMHPLDSRNSMLTPH